MTQNILVDAQAGIVTLTINRPERKNSFTAQMYSAMAQTLAQAESDAGARVVVIQGDETAFSAGNDIGDFLHQPPSGQDAPVFRFLRSIASFPKPIIAAACGPAVGVGTTLLLHCDVVYAGDNAMFSTPFVNLGLVPEAASSLLLPHLFGYHRAAEALLLGEPFGAEAAHRMGLVSRVLPARDAASHAHDVAAKLAAKPSASLLETKRLMKAGQHAPAMRQMELENALLLRMLGEPAAKEAFAAFAGKREPDFSKL